MAIPPAMAPPSGKKQGLIMSDHLPPILGCADAHAGRTLETTRLTPDRTCGDCAAAGK